MEHVDADERRQARKDFATGLTGFGLAVAWLLVVGAISYFWAIS